MKKLKVLMVGLGGIGQRHLRNIRTKYGSDVDIIAYRVRNSKDTITSDLKIDKSTDFLKEYSIKVYTDLDKALCEFPDVAFVCNPSSLHIPISQRIAEMGCDLFIEKPLSNTLKGTKELVSTCERNKTIGMVGFQLRFHLCYRMLQQLIDANKIGNILSIYSEVGDYLPGFHKYEDYRHLYASKENLGGGVILSQIHEIDYLYGLFGMPHKVMAFGGHLSNLDIDVEDIADVLMNVKYKGTKIPIQLHMDYIQNPPSRYCKVIGEKGKITMDLVNSKVILEKVEANPSTYDFSYLKRNSLFLDEIDHFFDCVLNRMQPTVSIEEGTKSLKIALAIKESLEKEKLITL